MSSTEDIIERLSAEGASKQASVSRFVLPLLLVSAFCMAALVLILGEPFAPMTDTGLGPLAFKWGFSLPLVIGGAFALYALGHPGHHSSARVRFLAAPFVVVGILLAIDLTGPARETSGESWSTCLAAMALLSPIAFGAAILATRWLAPTKLHKAGMAAGIFGGAVAMSAYSPFCPELGLIFMVLYYVLPIGVMGAVGWLAGPRLLSW